MVMSMTSRTRVTWVGVVAPAEDALVGAGERGRGLHAAVALDAVEGVLVAAAPPAQHALRPAAQLHAAVGSCAANKSAWKVSALPRRI